MIPEGVRSSLFFWVWLESSFLLKIPKCWEYQAYSTIPTPNSDTELYPQLYFFFKNLIYSVFVCVLTFLKFSMLETLGLVLIFFF